MWIVTSVAPRPPSDQTSSCVTVNQRMACTPRIAPATNEQAPLRRRRHQLSDDRDSLIDAIGILALQQARMQMCMPLTDELSKAYDTLESAIAYIIQESKEVV